MIMVQCLLLTGVLTKKVTELFRDTFNLSQVFVESYNHRRPGQEKDIIDQHICLTFG